MLGFFCTDRRLNEQHKVEVFNQTEEAFARYLNSGVVLKIGQD